MHSTVVSTGVLNLAYFNDICRIDFSCREEGYYFNINIWKLDTLKVLRNYDHIFASIPVYDGSNREEFFPWLDHLEAACYYCGRDIKTEALGRSAGT